MKKYVIGIATMLISMSICGQDDTSIHHLEQVVVTATQHAVLQCNAPTIIDVVEGEGMQRAAATNLAEGLRMGLGVRTENTCQNCGANELRINGLGGEYTQILIDSRPLCSSLAGVYILEQLPTAMIDRVEVMRGGGSTLYGAGAVAGVVNVITKEPLVSEASVGNITRILDGQSVDWSSHFGASMVNEGHSAGLFVYGSNRKRTPYDRDGDGYSELGLLQSHMVGARAFVRTGQFGKLGVEYHNMHEFRRGGDRMDLPSPMAHISEGGEHDIHTGSVKWDLLPAHDVSQLSLYVAGQYVDRQSYYGERDDDEPYGTAYGYTTSLTTNEGVRYSHTFEHLLFMPATITAGAEHSYDRLDDRNLNSMDTMKQHLNVESAYLQSEWRANQWTILAGVRVDKHSAVERVVSSPRLSLHYAPRNHVVFRGGYASGFRAPQVFDDDLHAGAVQGELYKIANADGLRMERSHSFTASADVAFRLLGKDVDLLGEAFYTQINDAFALVWIDDGVQDGYRHYERRNAGGAVVRGVNVELSTAPLPRLNVKVGATMQQGMYSGEGMEYAEGKYERRMERSPNVYGFLNMTYSPMAKLTIAADGVYTGSMLVYHSVADDVEKVITPSFFDLSLRMEYRWEIGDRVALEFQAGVMNIFDAYQQDLDTGLDRDSKYIYGPTMPRTCFVGLKCVL